MFGWQDTEHLILQVLVFLSSSIAQSAGAVEYTDCFSEEG